MGKPKRIIPEFMLDNPDDTFVDKNAKRYKNLPKRSKCFWESDRRIGLTRCSLYDCYRRYFKDYRRK
ncbi:hypothetical protein [Sulfurimonas sp.]|uniref:hypothetical protein n=1 Tax=Sulfurimonas sp. TaxID=2022749 RepID=UPI0025CDB202|nr:hypothetical protein [Sulfurimonas sp.]MDD5158002.1 hypothetical protein [Sulfurimonas sp.]